MDPLHNGKSSQSRDQSAAHLFQIIWAIFQILSQWTGWPTVTVLLFSVLIVRSGLRYNLWPAPRSSILPRPFRVWSLPRLELLPYRLVSP